LRFLCRGDGVRGVEIRQRCAGRFKLGASGGAGLVLLLAAFLAHVAAHFIGAGLLLAIGREDGAGVLLNPSADLPSGIRPRHRALQEGPQGLLEGERTAALAFGGVALQTRHERRAVTNARPLFILPTPARGAGVGVGGGLDGEVCGQAGMVEDLRERGAGLALLLRAWRLRCLLGPVFLALGFAQALAIAVVIDPAIPLPLAAQVLVPRALRALARLRGARGRSARALNQTGEAHHVTAQQSKQKRGHLGLVGARCRAASVRC